VNGRLVNKKTPARGTDSSDDGSGTDSTGGSGTDSSGGSGSDSPDDDSESDSVSEGTSAHEQGSHAAKPQFVGVKGPFGPEEALLLKKWLLS
jgi:hypothetical protein